jgi:hypothetical protein
MAVDARFLLVQSKTFGVDPLVDAILSKEDNVEKAIYADVLELHGRPLKKRYIEACLLASNDIDRIADLLEISPELIRMYMLMFYDVYDLDKLSKLELLDIDDREEHAMKVWALSQGLEFMEWRLGKIVIVNPTDGLQELFTMCVFKSKEALFSGNSSNASREAVKWSKLSMDLARLIKAYVVDGQEAKADLELALASVAPEFTSFADLNQS